jgi:hypothetical protein
VRFFTTHGKQKQLTAPAPNGVGQPLPCAGSKTHGKHGLFAVRLPEKRTANIGCLPCACPKTHGKQGSLPCAPLKTHDKGTVLAVGFGHFAVRLPKTHGKVTLQFIFFWFSRLKIPKNHSNVIYIIIFITGINISTEA